MSDRLTLADLPAPDAATCRRLLALFAGPAPALQHGTANAYVRHKCRCGACRKANADRAKRARLRRASKPTGEIPHGLNGYSNYDCRCETCKTAGRAALEQQNEARRDRPDAIPHGSKSGYNFWGCRCDACERAAYDETNGSRRTANDRARATARHHYDPWTGAELGVAARTNLSNADVACMLGRTISAVINMRRKLRTDAKVIRAAGISDDA